VTPIQKLAAAAGIALLTSLCACALPGAIQVGPTPANDIGGAAALELRPGETTLAEALKRLRQRNATGIALAGGLDARDPRTTLHALTADLLGEVLLFENLRYARSLALAVDGGTARGLYLKLARLGKQNAVVAVSGVMTLQGVHGLRILLFGGGRAKRVHIGWDYFPEWIYGMKDPLIVGHDLAEGVTFVARKASEVQGSYVPWHRGAIVRLDGQKLAVEHMLMQRLLGCACIDAWYRLPVASRPADPLTAQLTSPDL
jgi:hypothetical protein